MAEIYIERMEGVLRANKKANVSVGDRKAPEGLRLGRRVRVVGSADEYVDPKFIGMEGTIIDQDDQECGATKEDPMWMVWFKGHGKDGFWGEELEVVK